METSYKAIAKAQARNNGVLYVDSSNEGSKN